MSDSIELPSTKEELLARHKKESRDLIATITGLKKQATKKTRKNVLIKCSELEHQLATKHKSELQKFDQDSEGNEGDVSNDMKNDDDEITPEKLLAQIELKDETTPLSPPHASTESQAKPKRNRQKERLERRKADLERIKQEAALEAANTVDYRQIEIDSMSQLLALNNLSLHEIKPDGHCLFASIQDQLLVRQQQEVTIEELRKKAGDYMLENKNDFIPFLFDEQTMELRDIEPYVQELVSTAMWGSDMEILALAKCFDCPISIYMAGASTHKINEEGNNAELKLGFYKHSYGLGEHYNSLRDLDQN
ncbi:uncharacterized protein RJT20DRAFT_90219 [Scheffersomyces xylosifermentans]|uniref:uncharacterized protein n=1 Tax=Scheffersomyces xylosifermentans TaxID=1304137 RepID=UPI00315DE3C8